MGILMSQYLSMDILMDITNIGYTNNGYINGYGNIGPW